MTEKLDFCFGNGRKHCGKSRCLVQTFFSLSYNVFKCFLSQGLSMSGLCGKELTHYHTMPHFDALEIYIAVENIVRKGEIACYKQFLLFSQCFLPYMALIFHFTCT